MTRRPVLQRTTFHTTLTVTSRQNATSTPGVSARLTSVELSENATTSADDREHPERLRADGGIQRLVAGRSRENILPRRVRRAARVRGG